MSSRRQKVAAVTVAFAAMAAVQVVAPLQASAHDTSAQLTNPGIRYGYGGVTNSHKRLYSCDTYRDGVGFRAEYRLKNGASGHVDDANGSKSGCSDITPGTSSNPIKSFRVILKGNYGGNPNGAWVYSGWYDA